MTHWKHKTNTLKYPTTTNTGKRDKTIKEKQKAYMQFHNNTKDSLHYIDADRRHIWLVREKSGNWLQGSVRPLNAWLISTSQVSNDDLVTLLFIIYASRESLFLWRQMQRRQNRSTNTGGIKKCLFEVCRSGVELGKMGSYQ